jgi:hypothetical protein
MYVVNFLGLSGSCLYKSENETNTMMVREDTNHGTRHEPWHLPRAIVASIVAPVRVSTNRKTISFDDGSCSHEPW